LSKCDRAPQMRGLAKLWAKRFTLTGAAVHADVTGPLRALLQPPDAGTTAWTPPVIIITLIGSHPCTGHAPCPPALQGSDTIGIDAWATADKASEYRGPGPWLR
jgi:hypothetical protein